MQEYQISICMSHYFGESEIFVMTNAKETHSQAYKGELPPQFTLHSNFL